MSARACNFSRHKVIQKPAKGSDHMRTALITGITGQHGSYLAEFLLAHGYSVNGIIRRSSTFDTDRIDQ